MSTLKTETKAIEQVLQSVRTPADVKSYELEFSEDSGGMPSVWINFHITDDNNPSPTKIQRLSEFKRRVSSAIFAKDITSWPHIRFVTR